MPSNLFGPDPDSVSRLESHMSGLEDSINALDAEPLPTGIADDTGSGDGPEMYVLGGDTPEDPVWTLISGGPIPGDPWEGYEKEISGSESIQKGFVANGDGSAGVAALGGQIVTTGQRNNPGMLSTLVRTSAHLRAPIDAYVTAVDSMGHSFVPTIQLADDVDAVRDIREATEFKRRLEIDDGIEDGDPGSSLAVSDAEVTGLVETIRADSRFERRRLNHIFDSFWPGSTFTELRRRTRDDIESTGIGYWEILRDEKGRPRYGCHVPSPSIRLVAPDQTAAEWVVYERESPLSVQPVTRKKRYKKYVQRGWGGHMTWYKEYGDPRVMSCSTGQYISDSDVLAGALPATEIYDWPIYDPLSPTGSPRWIGTMLSVQGSMAADRVNLDYFRAKPPAGMLLVTGGKLSAKVRTAITSKWQAYARGEDNFHGLVVIEATSPAGMPSQASGKVGIEFVPLTQTQVGDALFREYDKRNAEKIAITFRIPGIERGIQESSNRASAEIAVATTDTQVYQPLRNQFDDVINHVFLPAMGITLWKFRTNRSDPVDYDAAKIINTTAEKTNILDLNETRQAYAEAMNLELPLLDEDEQKSRQEDENE